jgi:hypothetical protein
MKSIRFVYLKIKLLFKGEILNDTLVFVSDKRIKMSRRGETSGSDRENWL